MSSVNPFSKPKRKKAPPPARVKRIIQAPPEEKRLRFSGGRGGLGVDDKDLNSGGTTLLGD